MSSKVIYCITSPTGAIYIGQTKDYKKRMASYRFLRCISQTKIYRSLSKYGFENHKFEKIHHFNPDVSQYVLDGYEMAYIKLFKENGFNLLNIANGGGAPMSGRKHSEETRKKMCGRFGELNPNYGKGCFGNTNGRARAIIQYDIQGNLIREWDTVTNASKELGVKRTTISANLIGLNKTAKGFIFKYKTPK